MTYCIAWKSESAVFLAADAAITSDAAPELERSTFGEKHGRLGGRMGGPYVKEEALKLHVIRDCAVTFSGTVSVGDKIISEMDAALAGGAGPLEAFSNATAARDPNSYVKMILAYRHLGLPRLATYNASGDRQVTEDVERVFFGSMKDSYDELTEKFLGTFLALQATPQRILAQALGLLQSYGIHDYLIEDGVGGGFCGMYVDPSGVHWQPDIFYVVAHPQLTDVGGVGSFARDNVWCLFSSLTTAGKIVFAHQAEGESGELYRQRVSPIARCLEEKHDRCEFDYVIVLNTSQHIVCVIELLGQREHDLLVVEPHPTLNGTLGIYWSPRVQGLFDTIVVPEGCPVSPDHICVQFIPYRPLANALSPDLRRDMRAKLEEAKGHAAD
jgi:hypothetical protein